MAYEVQKTDEEWREQLSRDEYAVLRKAGTERAFTGEYTDTKTVGVYRCRACDAELFIKRVEVRCASCGSHLGHVFDDGYGTPTGQRYCINSISMTLEPTAVPADRPAE